MNTFLKYTLIMLLGWQTSVNVMAQEYSVRIKTDKKEIRLGEPFELTITAKTGENVKVSWPILPDSVGEGFEILERKSFDTIRTKGAVTYQQKFAVTAWDSGLFAIPPIRIDFRSGVSEASAYTDTVKILVKSEPVAEGKGYRDIKGPVDMPFSIREILPFILIVVILVVVGLTVYFLLRRFRKTVPPKVVEEVKVQPELPHVEALKLLEQLRQKQLWQQGFLREYYDDLSMVLRHYLERRFSLDAEEMVTREILNHLRNMVTHRSSLEILESVLRHSDMVKFAKGIPTADENERMLAWAREFVLQTSPDESESVEPVNPES